MKKNKFIWRDNISFKETLELIDYWVENYPNGLRNIPKKLSRKIKRKHLEILQQPYREKGKISALGLQNLRESIENKLDEKEKEHSYREWQKKQLKQSKDIYIANISLVIITFLLCMGTLIMAFTSWKSLEFQIESYSPPIPALEFGIIDRSKFLCNANLVQVNHLKNWTFWHSPQIIEFLIINKGKGYGRINFYLIDPDKKFKTAYSFNKEIAPLDSEYINFYLNYKKCHDGKGKEEYKLMKSQGCNLSELTSGLKKFILVADCPLCDLKEQRTCYLVNVCIYNQTLKESWCKENFNKKEFELNKIECPEEVY